MGNYTAKAFQGFMKDPSQDRAAAATQLSEAVGGKMESFDIIEFGVDDIVRSGLVKEYIVAKMESGF